MKAPTRYAMRELKLSYLDRVQEETTNFLNERIKHDFLRPDKELTLDLTVNEAEILMTANEEVRALAEKGELKKLHANYNALKDKVEADYLQVREHIQKILHAIEEKENDLYTKLAELGIEGLKRHGQDSAFDLFGLATGNPSFSNLTLVEAAIQNGHEAAEQLKGIAQKLQAYIGIKARYFEIKIRMREEYINKVALGDDSLRNELREMQTLKDRFEGAFERNKVTNEEYETYINSLNQIANSQVKAVINDFGEYEKAYNERKRFYFHFTREHDNEALDTFRTDLLQHLAGSIVVKEHRLRYQKEQFDRFISSLQYNKLYKKDQALRDFCKQYAHMIELLIEDSYNDRSPKIEANYDDFAERTIRPLNATIFYYFFSADRRKKTIAQWLLSAARYPSDKVRRAYMRFFA